MKIKYLIFLFLLSFYAGSIAQTYTSHITEYITINKVEEIRREIEIDQINKSFTITSYGNKDNLQHIQEYKIVGDVYKMNDGTIGYKLKSLEEKNDYNAIFIPNNGNPYFTFSRLNISPTHKEHFIKMHLNYNINL